MPFRAEISRAQGKITGHAVFSSTTSSSSTSPRKSATQAGSRTSTKAKKTFWSHAEDKALVDAVERLGEQWVKVKEVLEENHWPPRRFQTIRTRYKLLLATATRQYQAAALSTPKASSSSQPKPYSAPALMAASAALLSKDSRGWTPEQMGKLIDIGRSESELQKVYAAFQRAFPSANKSQNSIRVKLLRLRLGRHYGRPGKGPSAGAGEAEGEGETDEADGQEEEQEEQEEEDADGEEGKEVVAPASSPSQPASFFHGQERGTGERNQRMPALRAPITSQVPPQVAARLPLTQGHPLQGSSSSSLNVAIDFQPNGLRISSCPPGYGIRITSPTCCYVVGPEAWCKQEEEGQAAVETAAFAVRMKMDGAIEAINLPQGTATSICLVRARVGDGRGDAKARDDGRLVSQTSFVAKDGFSVVFESEEA